MKTKLICIALCVTLLAVIWIGKIQTEKDPGIAGKLPPASSPPTAQNTEGRQLENIFLIEGKGKQLTVFMDGEKKQFALLGGISEEIKNEIGDLEIAGDQVVKINRKPDQISGKILSAADSYVELEEYGKVPYAKEIKIYHMGETMEMGTVEDIKNGQSGIQFVIAGDEICAVLIEKKAQFTQEGEDKKIRVLIKTDSFKKVLHNGVTLSADCAFSLTDGKTKKNYAAGEKLEINHKLLKTEKGVIETQKKGGKITLLSVKRGSGNPSYRGKLEVEKRENAFTIINELPLEEYLYAVLPSEMPADAEQEALKVQAVCARSYACKQMTDQKYQSYGANVDDSVSFQVYNNYPETGKTIQAVKDTQEEIAVYDNEVISAYYFSTSCGTTSAMGEVWLGGGKVRYLKGELQNIEPLSKAEQAKSDFSVEGNFRKFLKEDMKTYDSEFPYYRWKVELPLKEIKKSIDQNLYDRYEANPEWVKTLDGDGVYRSIPIRTIGTVKEIKEGKRAASGLLTEILLVGSKQTVKVSSEYNIRKILAPRDTAIHLQDGSNSNSLSMLPSAYFVIDKMQTAKSVTGFRLSGGGFGHGVGMSQNGVMKMAELGMDYKTIIGHYFPGAEVQDLSVTETTPIKP